MLGGAGVGLRPLPSVGSYVPRYQAAIINGFTPQTSVRLIRAGLATDKRGTPTLALSRSAASDARGPADPRSKVGAGRRRIAGSPRDRPFATPPLRPARWLPARGQCTSRGLGRLCCSTKSRGLSAGLSLIARGRCLPQGKKARTTEVGKSEYLQDRQQGRLTGRAVHPVALPPGGAPTAGLLW
jgi:hypothetical protein